jgi:hypothetical protein
VSMIEFSPDTSTFRNRRYFCYPFLGWSNEWSSPLADRVREFDDGRVPPESPPRWEIAFGSKYGAQCMRGNASTAYGFLCSRAYRDWTEDHPELAREFWPRVIQWLREDRYNELDRLQMLALNAQTKADLERAFAEAQLR